MTKLREKRKERKLSAREVAEALNIGVKALYSYEKNIREPKQAILKKLAQFFNCTVDELIQEN